MSRIRRNIVWVGELILIAVDSPQPRMGLRRPFQEAGVRYVDKHAAAVVARADSWFGFDSVRHLPGLSGGAGSYRCDRQDVIRCRDTRTVLPVDLRERPDNP